MRISTCLSWLSALACALLLTSCIDGREEFWLEADGGGRADVSYTIPSVAAKFHGGEAGVKQLLAETLASTPAIKSSTHEVTSRDGRITIHVKATFKSATDLKQASDQAGSGSLPSAAQGLAGRCAVSLKGRAFDFSRTIDAGKALPGSLFMPASEFQNHKLVYIVHLPLAASESNALRTRDGGKTLEWEFPLEQAVRRPVVTRFKATIPVPPWLMASAGGGILILGMAGYAWLRGRRRHKKSPGT